MLGDHRCEKLEETGVGCVRGMEKGTWILWSVFGWGYTDLLWFGAKGPGTQSGGVTSCKVTHERWMGKKCSNSRAEKKIEGTFE